jgi:adenosine deaminase CECR1
VLSLVADLRNHPAAMLFTNGFPLVISSDDPVFFFSQMETYFNYFRIFIQKN